jgi:hypothetical protein
VPNLWRENVKAQTVLAEAHEAQTEIGCSAIQYSLRTMSSARRARERAQGARGARRKRREGRAGDIKSLVKFHCFRRVSSRVHALAILFCERKTLPYTFFFPPTIQARTEGEGETRYNFPRHFD